MANENERVVLPTSRKRRGRRFRIFPSPVEHVGQAKQDDPPSRIPPTDPWIMDLVSQVQDLLDLSSHVTALLQNLSENLNRKRTLAYRKGEEEDVNVLSADIVLASRSLRVLEVRREVRTAVEELAEVKRQLREHGWERSRKWLDYVQDTMEHLHVLLKKGLDLASKDEGGQASNNDNVPPLPSKDNHTHKDVTLLNSNANSGSGGEDKSRRISCVFDDPEGGSQQRRVRENLTRRHSVDHDGIPAARLFIGNLGLKAAPAKAATTVSLSHEQSTADTTARSSKRCEDAPLLQISCTDLSTDRRLTHAVSQGTEELTDEFVDALESVDEESTDQHVQCSSDIRELTALTERLMRKKGSKPGSLYSVRSFETIAEDDCDDEDVVTRSHSERSESEDDAVTISSIDAITPLSTSPPPSSVPFQIAIGRDNPTHLFAEEVTVGDPIRVGAGYGSYIVYACTVKGQEGANIIVRKRYSDFVKLRSLLVKTHPQYKKLLPKLPPKTMSRQFGADFIEHRRKDLEYFLMYVLLHPMLGATPVVRRWFVA